MRVLVTGANGFIGREMCRILLARGHSVRGALRDEAKKFALSGVEFVGVGDIHHETSWEGALVGVDTVVHLAARVHRPQDKSIAAFRNVNAAGTLQLAQAAVRAGVRRLVYISSIHVNGKCTQTRPFTEHDIPNPPDAYAISKSEAEQALSTLAAQTGLELVIIRPPLVYGPGNQGNFMKLMRLVSLGIPLPLASIKNLRSLIFVGNLIDAIASCLVHPAAAGQTFLVSDRQDVSTPELMACIAASLHKTACLFPFPVHGLRVAGVLSGTSCVVERLTRSLAIDSSKIERVLGWTPPYTLVQGVSETANWYCKRPEGSLSLSVKTD